MMENRREARATLFDHLADMYARAAMAERLGEVTKVDRLLLQIDLDIDRWAKVRGAADDG